VASKEFQAWGDGKSPAFQKFMAEASTPGDIAPILAQYKAETEVETAAQDKSKSTTVADAQRKAKAETDKLNSATTRNRRPATKPAGSGTSEAELDAAFDEDDD